MNQMTDVIALNRAAKGGNVRHVALDEPDLAQLLVIDYKPQAMQVFLQIVDPHLVAALQKVTDDPTSDAAITAGEKDAHDVTPRAVQAFLACRLRLPFQRVGFPWASRP